jgi:hypothetical protein
VIKMVAIYDHWSNVATFLSPCGPSPAVSVSDYSFGINKIEEHLWASHAWHEA